MNSKTEKQRLILHIGIHRTGSTSIQRVLHANRDALHAQGFHYALNTVNHTSLANDLDRSRASARSCIDTLVKDADSFPAHTVIVSGEDLCRIRNTQWLETFKDHFDVRILCYVRRQDEWLESWYNQHIKWPWDERFAEVSPDDFFARRSEFDWLHYAPMLARWADVFGQQSITLRPFEQGQLIGSVVEDFCAECDIDFAALSVPPHTHNASISAMSLCLLRHLGLLDKVGGERIYLLSRVNKAIAAAGLVQCKHVFSPAQRLAFLSEFVADNESVARDFLGRSDGRLFLAEPPSVDDPEPELTLPPSAELVSQVIRPIVIDYLDETDRLLGPHDLASEAKRARFKLIGQRSRLVARRDRVTKLCTSRSALLERLRRQLLFRPAVGSSDFDLAILPAEESSSDMALSETMGQFGQMLLMEELGEIRRVQLVQVLVELETRHSGFDLESVATEVELLLSGLVRPLVDLLGERRLSAQRLATLEADHEQAALVREKVEVEQLATEVQALESQIATPLRTGLQLWRLMWSSSPE